MILPYPKTKDEWWNNVDVAWDDLLDIMYMFLPMNGVDDYDRSILPHTLEKEIRYCRKNRDSKLARYFNAAWWIAPDHPSIHQIPSWGVLCDLCSEEYVLYEENDGNQRAEAFSLN